MSVDIHPDINKQVNTRIAKPENPHLDFELWQYLERRSDRLKFGSVIYICDYYSMKKTGNLRAVCLIEGKRKRFVNYRDKWEKSQ